MHSSAELDSVCWIVEFVEAQVFLAYIAGVLRQGSWE